MLKEGKKLSFEFHCSTFLSPKLSGRRPPKKIPLKLEQAWLLFADLHRASLNTPFRNVPGQTANGQLSSEGSERSMLWLTESKGIEVSKIGKSSCILYFRSKVTKVSSRLVFEVSLKDFEIKEEE